MEQRCINLLDDDCWELIFKKLRENRHDIASISSVCKTFLSITNGIKTGLRIKSKSTNQFARLLQRFPHLKSVDIEREPHEKLIVLIDQILQSGLELEALSISFAKNPSKTGLRGSGAIMKSLKKLTVATPWCDDDLISLTDLFPGLEEIGIICFPNLECPSITDVGIEALASKLKGLVKISLMFCRKITDQSLISLSSNCLNLANIRIAKCPFLTENGIGFMMRNCVRLTSLTLNFWALSLSNGDHPFTIENSISYARNLEEIHMFGMKVSDALLRSVANSCHSLKKVDFKPRSDQRNFTIHGLKMLVMAHPTLEYLNLGINWMTDEFMVEISQYLHSLTRINLDGNTELSSATFFMLTKICHFLERIDMTCTSVGTCTDLVLCSHQNYRVNCLSICSSKLMNDRALKIFGSVCPNLERLLAKDCPLLTNEGISEIVKICPKLRFLEVSNLNVSNFLGPNEEDSKLMLKTIFASKTKIGDKCMKLIGMRCPDLEDLDIKDCRGVTRHGVEEVVKNCKKIRNIYMNKCECVSIELLQWMVMKRPSLERIVVSRGYFLSEEQKNLFSRNGSLILNTEY